MLERSIRRTTMERLSHNVDASRALPQIPFGFSEFNALEFVARMNCVRPLKEPRSVTAICRSWGSVGSRRNG
jgi:hypothetical protein